MCFRDWYEGIFSVTKISEDYEFDPRLLRQKMKSISIVRFECYLYKVK